MRLRYDDFPDFIAISKGFGWRTHQVAPGQFGIVEFLTEKLATPFFVVHRLDKDTSGLMLFAKSKASAEKLSKLFSERKIQKTYLFLTDRPCQEESFQVAAAVTASAGSGRQQERFFIDPKAPDNSWTDFKFVKKVGDFFLWRAHPQTGKPHQIRLHAAKARIPILGDAAHGGTEFFRLALHAERLRFTYDEKIFDIMVSAPELFTREQEMAAKESQLLQACLEKRQAIYEIPKNEAFRLVHEECSYFKADIFGDKLWIYDYSEKGLSIKQRQEILQFANRHRLQLYIRYMKDRGQGVGGLEQKTLTIEGRENSQMESHWECLEESVRYVMKLDAGFSVGLFLDQRENRFWVRHNSEKKKVLNLFCYTGGFSVNAVLGGATQVTSVDVSAKFLEWVKENFQANGIEFQNHEYFVQDAVLFLKLSAKKGRTWDLIVCDPPTFGRSKNGVWKIERDLPLLAQLLVQCLSKNGKILFTCNLEKMNRVEILNLFSKQLVEKNKLNFSRCPQLSLDFGQTDDLANLTKGFILEMKYFT